MSDNSSEELVGRSKDAIYSLRELAPVDRDLGFSVFGLQLAAP